MGTNIFSLIACECVGGAAPPAVVAQVKQIVRARVLTKCCRQVPGREFLQMVIDNIYALSVAMAFLVNYYY